MKKILQIVAIVLFAAFVVTQFFRPDFTNPPVTQAETIEASMQIPENVRQILKRSCTDCHSNETVYPWYAQIQPSGTFLKGHIDDGRKELNFSIWNTYDARKKRHKLDEICEQVEAREMPLPSYLWIHRSARVSDEEIKTLCDWANAEKAKFDQEAPK